jgi:uncharacterized protein YciI
VRVLYLYWMKDDPDRVTSTAPQHASYWHELGLPAYLGGPFGDRSGGLITFGAESLEQAEGIIAADPFVRENLLESSVVKQWMTE